MFRLLLLSFDKYDVEQVYQICNQMQDITIYENTSLENTCTLCKYTKVDCILLFPDMDFILAKRFLTILRKTKTYKHTPVVLLSTQLSHTFQVFPQWHCCEFFHYPLNQEAEDALQHLLSFYYEQSSHNPDVTNEIFQLNTAQGIHNLHYDELLFVETVLKKSIFHTKTQELTSALPLYKIKNALHSNHIMQTHRSFIVNLNNISYLDKRKNPWEISFCYTEQKAYVGRNYKKAVLEALYSNA